MNPSYIAFANHIYRSTRDELLLPYISPLFSLLVAFVAFLLGADHLLLGALGFLALLAIAAYNSMMNTVHMDEYRRRLFRYLDEHRDSFYSNNSNRRSPRLAERKIEEIPSYAE